MQLCRQTALRTTQFTVAIAAWCLMSTAVLAETPPPEGPPEKSYVLAYLLVVLCCALGLMIVGRSANRRTELKYSDDDD